MKETEYQPITSANTDRLTVELDLPFGLGNEIGLKVDQLRVLCQIAGFKHLLIKSPKKPRISKSIPTIVGINSHGESYAGLIVSDTVPTAEQEFGKINDHRFLKNGEWRDLRISLNLSEIQQRILLSEEDVRIAENWVKELNQALTDAIIKAGLKHLLLTIEDKLNLYITICFWLSKLSRLLSGNSSKFLISMLYDAFLWNLLGSLNSGKEDFKNGEGYRMSIFLGIELDRAALLLFLAKSSVLVGEIEPDLTEAI